VTERRKPGPAKLPRLPLAPLIKQMNTATYNDLGLIVGAKRSTMQRAATYGVTIHQADHWAVRCGLHPSSVWPEYFDLAAQMSERKSA